MITIDFSSLKSKTEHLNWVRNELKKEFFGIDSCIDNIIESIKTWYLMPEIVVRPIISNLFGLTGVGKTALVRSLVKHLGMETKFVEIQMDGFSNGDSDTPKSIASILAASSIEEGKPGIILLDEFQRFRTIDERGADVKVERYNDVWMLLSDGCFPNNYSYLVKLEKYLLRSDYWDDKRAADEAEAEARKIIAARNKIVSEMAKADEEEKSRLIKIMGWGEPSEAISVDPDVAKMAKYKRKFYLTMDESETIKEMLRIPESVEEIMYWSKDKVRQVLREAIEKKDNPPIDYTKCLIFVSGNLDEAFSMSSEIEDCDTNADIYHDYTKKIGGIEVKKALARRFKPEQIARLGNNHIVYPSLGVSAYLSIIKRACQSYLDETKKICDIQFLIEPRVYQEIYDNSVYPAQGTRPVFSSVHKMFGSPISDAILWGLELGLKKVVIDVDISSSIMIFSSNDNVLRIKIDAEMREKRNKNSPDFNALVSIHEVGHALVYASLFKMPPVEIAISLASFKGGYNRFQNEHLSKEETLNRIAVSMGGIVAEELIFGQEMRSTGCASDIEKATRGASDYVRQYGMDGFVSLISRATDMTGHAHYNTDLGTSNPNIEQILNDQKNNAQTILTQHRDLLVDLSKHLLQVKKMTAKEFVDYVGGKIEGLQPFVDKDVSGNYAQRLNNS